MAPDGERNIELGLGTARLRSINGGLSRRRAARLVQTAYDGGIRFVDTAPSYGQGDAEALLGSLPTDVRNGLTICTKVGYQPPARPSLLRAAKPILRIGARSLAPVRTLVARQRGQADASMRNRLDPAAIVASCRASLARLRRDRVDILLLHEPDSSTVDREDNIATLHGLQQRGTIGAWGISTRDEDIANRAPALDGLSYLQVPVHRGSLVANGELLGRCRRQGIAIIASSVLAGTAPDPDALETGVERERQLALRTKFEYAMSRDGVSVVLVGTTNRDHLLEDMAMVEAIKSEIR